MASSVRHITSHFDASLSARVVETVSLRYRLGADAEQDRPAIVRAASGLDWTNRGGRTELAVVQDDASFIAFADPETGLCDAIALPRGDKGARQFDSARGNKWAKPDFEAIVGINHGTRLLAFGSGSTLARQKIAIVEIDSSPRVADAASFYETLRNNVAFAGSELNLEGAVCLNDGTLRLFQRGNGALREDLCPIDATCDLALDELLRYLDDPTGREPTPRAQNIVAFDLGMIDGVRLTFTDGALGPSGLFYVAAAEASPNTVDDGPVAGCAIGRIDRDQSARWAPLCNPMGGPLAVKAEGLAIDPRDPTIAYVVVDADDPHVPSALCRIALEGPWTTG